MSRRLWIVCAIAVLIATRVLGVHLHFGPLDPAVAAGGTSPVHSDLLGGHAHDPADPSERDSSGQLDIQATVLTKLADADLPPLGLLLLAVLLLIGPQRLPAPAQRPQPPRSLPGALRPPLRAPPTPV
ncbi:MAG TPA: hypothetical protein QF361_01790 [Gammaproteobacteria bacterium]|nr:hypothetical protein [Gammaproteobacteria bacterium]